MTFPEAKPIATLTKKSYSHMCDYITNTSPDNAPMILKMMTEAMRAATGFDPNVKRSPEECRKIAEHQRKLLAEEKTTHYEKYVKPRYERLRQQFPNAPATKILTTPVSKLQTF